MWYVQCGKRETGTEVSPSLVVYMYLKFLRATLIIRVEIKCMNVCMYVCAGVIACVHDS